MDTISHVSTLDHNKCYEVDKDNYFSDFWHQTFLFYFPPLFLNKINLSLINLYSTMFFLLYLKLNSLFFNINYDYNEIFIIKKEIFISCKHFRNSNKTIFSFKICYLKSLVLQLQFFLVNI